MRVRLKDFVLLDGVGPTPPGTVVTVDEGRAEYLVRAGLAEKAGEARPVAKTATEEPDPKPRRSTARGG